MNRASFIAAIVAAQDSAATTPRVAADQTSVPAVAAHLAARPQGTAGDAEDSRSSGSLGTLPTPDCGTQTSNQGAAAMSAYSGRQGKGAARRLREKKRTDAEARNAVTVPERRREYRRLAGSGGLLDQLGGPTK